MPPSSRARFVDSTISGETAGRGCATSPELGRSATVFHRRRNVHRAHHEPAALARRIGPHQIRQVRYRPSTTATSPASTTSSANSWPADRPGGGDDPAEPDHLERPRSPALVGLPASLGVMGAGVGLSSAATGWSCYWPRRPQCSSTRCSGTWAGAGCRTSTSRSPAACCDADRGRRRRDARRRLAEPGHLDQHRDAAGGRELPRRHPGRPDRVPGHRGRAHPGGVPRRPRASSPASSGGLQVADLSGSTWAGSTPAPTRSPTSGRWWSAGRSPPARSPSRLRRRGARSHRSVRVRLASGCTPWRSTRDRHRAGPRPWRPCSRPRRLSGRAGSGSRRWSWWPPDHAVPPGLSIYRGLTLLATDPSGALLAMATAAAIAIGLSTGAILGEYLAQPDPSRGPTPRGPAGRFRA